MRCRDFAAIANEIAHLVFQRLKKRCDFIRRAFDDALDAAVGAVADRTGYIEGSGYAAGGKPEADSLNVTDEPNNALLFGHQKQPLQSL
jgi:hypothetical protein